MSVLAVSGSWDTSVATADQPRHCTRSTLSGPSINRLSHRLGFTYSAGGWNIVLPDRFVGFNSTILIRKDPEVPCHYPGRVSVLFAPYFKSI